MGKVEQNWGNFFPNFMAAVHDFSPRALDSAQVGQLDAVLAQLTRPVRVGACTLRASLSVALPGTLTADVTWPAGCGSADVVFLVHPGPVSARMQDRINAGPAHFVLVPTPEDIPAAWAALRADTLALARARHLEGQLRGLALTAPQLSPLIDALAADRTALASNVRKFRPRVSVLGALPAGTELGEVEVVSWQQPAVDVVIAIRPPSGWSTAQVQELTRAWQTVGRMIEVTGASISVPCVPGAEVVRAAELATAIGRACATPALASLPEPQLGLWERTAARWEATQCVQLRSSWERDPLAACASAGIRAPMQWTATFAAELVVITGLSWLMLSRALDGVALMMAVAAVVGVRGVVKQQQLRKNWARGELTAGLPALPGDARATWVRREMARLD